MKRLLVSIGLINTLIFGSVMASMYTGNLWARFPHAKQEAAVLNAPKPGEPLNVLVDVVRTQECPSAFYREVYDGTGARVSQQTWTQGAKPIGPEAYTVVIPIPDFAKPGPNARYCFAQRPMCNIVQQVLPYWTPLKCTNFEISE